MFIPLVLPIISGTICWGAKKFYDYYSNLHNHILGQFTEEEITIMSVNIPNWPRIDMELD
jgi:hypothetical protein